jgi:hypothetical protein
MELDDFNCTLCNILYNTKERMPHLLAKCGHTFCHQCLMKRLKGNEIICPEDDIIYYNVNKIDDLPKNITVINLMHKLLKRRMTEITDYTSPIESDLVKSKTNDSNSNSDLRKSLTVSRRRFSSNVTEFSISENQESIKSIEKIEECRIHKRPLEIVCLDHKIKICTTCALFGDHKNHSLRSQEDLMKEGSIKAELLIQYYEIIEKSSEILVCDRSSNIESNLVEQDHIYPSTLNLIDQIKNKTSLMKKKVSSFFSTLRSQIDLKEKKLLQEVEARFENVFIQKYQIYEDYRTNIITKITSWRQL